MTDTAAGVHRKCSLTDARAVDLLSSGTDVAIANRGAGSTRHARTVLVAARSDVALARTRFLDEGVGPRSSSLAYRATKTAGAARITASGGVTAMPSHLAMPNMADRADPLLADVVPAARVRFTWTIAIRRGLSAAAPCGCYEIYKPVKSCDLFEIGAIDTR
jgi:hypothetical protein